MGLSFGFRNQWNSKNWSSKLVLRSDEIYWLRTNTKHVKAQSRIVYKNNKLNVRNLQSDQTRWCLMDENSINFFVLKITTVIYQTNLI